jgi:hypothetical protein
LQPYGRGLARSIAGIPKDIRAALQLLKEVRDMISADPVPKVTTRV